MKKIKFYTRLALKIGVEFFCLISNNFREHFFFCWGGILCESWKGYSCVSFTYVTNRMFYMKFKGKYIVSEISKNVKTWGDNWDITKQQHSRFTLSPCFDHVDILNDKHQCLWCCQSVDCLAQEHDNLSLILYTYVKIQMLQCTPMILEREKWTQVDSVAWWTVTLDEIEIVSSEFTKRSCLKYNVESQWERH